MRVLHLSPVLCACALLFALSPHSAALDLGGDSLPMPSSKEGMNYIFKRGGDANPRYSTSMLKGSIEGLPRPLYLAGYNHQGTITAALRDDDGLGALASAGGLVDFGELHGSAVSVFNVYPPKTDLPNHVGRYWFEQGSPDIMLHLTKVGELTKPREQNAREGQQIFEAPVEGSFEVDGNSIAFATTSRIILREAVAQGDSARPPSMEFVMTWTMSGEDFGWTGPQGGDITWRLYKQGFGDTKEEAQRLFDQGLGDHLLP